MDRSFKADGGVGGGLAAPPIPETSKKVSDMAKFYKRFIFDNLYNILLMIIMISIVSGIIIDKFADMREEQEEQDADKKNVCFICHNERDTIDKAAGDGDGFNNHIEVPFALFTLVRPQPLDLPLFHRIFGEQERKRLRRH